MGSGPPPPNIKRPKRRSGDSSIDPAPDAVVIGCPDAVLDIGVEWREDPKGLRDPGSVVVRPDVSLGIEFSGQLVAVVTDERAAAIGECIQQGVAYTASLDTDDATEGARVHLRRG